MDETDRESEFRAMIDLLIAALNINGCIDSDTAVSIGNTHKFLAGKLSIDGFIRDLRDRYPFLFTEKIRINLPIPGKF